MSIANDAWIRKMSLEKGMIIPFEEKLVAKGKISFGLSSYGYDVRVGRHFKIFHNLNSTLVDPKAFDARSFVDHDGDECIIPPNSFVLAETVERFKIHKVLKSRKSTYARCGIIVNVTPLEPVGGKTIEISNTTPLPAKIYANGDRADLRRPRGRICQTS